MFRANVLLREDACRVTRVSEPRHLKASHIKPWRDATDAERLDGSNGLLLSPHIDHLFDEGYITFSSSQELVIVPEVRDKLLDAWGIDAGVRVGEFSREQNAYLDYHRVERLQALASRAIGVPRALEARLVRGCSLRTIITGLLRRPHSFDRCEALNTNRDCSRSTARIRNCSPSCRYTRGIAKSRVRATNSRIGLSNLSRKTI